MGFKLVKSVIDSPMFSSVSPPLVCSSHDVTNRQTRINLEATSCRISFRKPPDSALSEWQTRDSWLRFFSFFLSNVTITKQEYNFSTFPPSSTFLCLPAATTLQCCPLIYWSSSRELRDSIYIYGLIINSSECIVFNFFSSSSAVSPPTDSHRNSLCQNIQASGLLLLLFSYN